jgi:hypothetical protein
MKKMFFAFLSFTFLSAGAQTVDEVIQKYATNLGGLDAFNKIKTAKFTGTLTSQGNDLTMTLQVVNGKAIRQDIEVMGSQIINVYNNGKGWKQNPFAGAPAPADMSAAEVADMKPQSMMAPALMDYKARGHQVELLGQETIGGIKTHKIKLTNKDDGKVTTYYINASDYTLIKSEAEREMQGQTVTVESWYSDLKEVNGLKFPMSRIQKIAGEEFAAVKLDTVELNGPIDEKIFDKP